MIKIESCGKEKNEFKNDNFVCFCFEYTKKDIENDFIDNGKSLILKKISLAKKNDGCDCAIKNPEGR